MNYDDGPQDLTTSKALRWKRFWLPTRVTVYLHRTFRHQVCFVSWKVPLCGSRKPLWTDRQWAEQERVGPVSSDSVKVTPETCSVLSDTGNITTLCFLYKPFSLGLHRPYSYARARLFGSDSSSKATKDIYFSGVPKYKYKAFNSSAASPDRRCTSHNPTSNQPNYHFLFLSGFIKPQQAHRSEPHHSCCVTWKAQTASNCCIQQQQSREEGIQRDFSGKHSTETLN